MPNGKHWPGILLIALVFGLTFVGCGGDSSLNGTWVGSYYGQELTLIFKNGSFEGSYGNNPVNKGTYTTSENNMNAQTTHVQGSLFGLDSKWYTKAEFKATPFGSLVPDANLNEMFASWTTPYSISGNKLTFTWQGKPSTLTKK